MNKTAFERLNLLPPIQRSRGFRLYARDGRRFLDFWQEGGAGMLGSRPGSSIHFIKNDLEAGRGMRLPSDPSDRLGKTALRLFPGYAKAFCFSCRSEAAEAMAEAGMDPRDAAEWRPFLPVPDAPALLVLPPMPEILRPAIILARGGSGALRPGLPAAFQLRAAVRALCDIKREETEGLPARLGLWELFDRLGGLRIFRREGPYLRPLDTEGYAATFSRFLKGGVLLSPDPALPSIVPGSFNAGELPFLKEASL